MERRLLQQLQAADVRFYRPRRWLGLHARIEAHEVADRFDRQPVLVAGPGEPLYRVERPDLPVLQGLYLASSV